MDPILQRLIIGFIINLLFGIVAFMREMVNDTGFLTGVVVFTLSYVFLDWMAYPIIIVFFAINSVIITLENRHRARSGAFELYKAKRSSSRVLGRSLAGTIFAGLFFLKNMPEYKLAFVASYAQAIFDSVSSKMGKMYCKTAWSILTFRKVRSGMPGGITAVGILFGLLATGLLCIVGALIKLIELKIVWVVLVSALIGDIFDSILNAISYRREYLHNEFINFFSSMMAGVICVLLGWYFGVLPLRL